MTIRANVERSRGGIDQRLDYGEITFAALPRIGEQVTIDGVEDGFTRTVSGLVVGVEPLIDSDGQPTLTVHIDFE